MDYLLKIKYSKGMKEKVISELEKYSLSAQELSSRRLENWLLVKATNPVAEQTISELEIKLKTLNNGILVEKVKRYSVNEN